ncbi:MAG TPA: MFS transporter [Gemmataceae bacterium]|nr:MFS transporter [Gemmataceae bacterium]
MVLFAIGFGMMVQMAGSNTLLQTVAAEDKRGRVMSFYTMAFLGMAPLGSLLTGVLAAWLGPTITLIINGSICLTGAGLFALSLPRLRRLVQPIYVRLSILPPLTTGIAAASELETAMKE